MDRVMLTIPVEEGSDEYVEIQVDRSDIGGDAIELMADESGRRVRTTAYSLGASLDRVLPAVRAILTRLRRDEHAPDEIGLEWGLSVGGETGLFFAKGTADATFTVKLTWRRPDAT